MEEDSRKPFPPDSVSEPAMEGQEEKFYEDVSARRKVLICVSYILGFLAVLALFADAPQRAYYYPVIAALFSLMVLWRPKDAPRVRRPRECWVWLAGMGILVFAQMCMDEALPLKFGRIWMHSLLPSFVFAPFCAGYFALMAGGKATDNCSGSWIILDALHSFFLLPLGGLFDRAHTLNTLRLNHIYTRKKNRAGATAGALLTAIVLFVAALMLLKNADEGFSKLLSSLPSLADADFNFGELILKLILSVPLGAYLFAQISGIDRLDRIEIVQRQALARTFLKRMRRVSTTLWCVLLGCFAAMYLLFSGVQMHELTTAYRSNWAPGSLTMASFAKQGFFEMCAVMALNFVLMFIAEKSSERSLRESLAGRCILTLVTLCSLLFAASAMIKLYMYLRSFGFTALRLQGAWGISVLVTGCLCTLIWIWKKWDCTRAWILISFLLLMATFFY